MNIALLKKFDPGRSASEWTEVSDIGRSFGGKILTHEEYVNVENKYVKALKMLMNSNSVKQLKIYSKGEVLPTPEMAKRHLFGIDQAVVSSYRHGEWVSGERLLTFCRLCLRGLQAHAVSDEKSFFLQFTGDYCVWVGSPSLNDNVRAEVKKLGLFLVSKGELGDEGIDNEFFLMLLPRL